MKVISIFRSVAEEQRSLALGVQSVLWRAFGSIPGPIIFGVIFDSSCTYWQYDCGRRGNCWVYDNSSISIRAFFITVTGVLINCVFMLLCWIFFPPYTTCRQTDKGDGKFDGTVSNPTFNLEDSGRGADEERGVDKGRNVLTMLNLKKTLPCFSK